MPPVALDGVLKVPEPEVPAAPVAGAGARGCFDGGGVVASVAMIPLKAGIWQAISIKNKRSTTSRSKP